MKRIFAFLQTYSRKALYAATTDFVPLAKPPDTSRLGNLYGSQNLGDFVNKAFLFAITIGAILAVVRLMWAGYLYMGSADMWSSKQKAKEVMGDVVFGLLLLLAIFLILRQINPQLISLDILQRLQSNPVPRQQQSSPTSPQQQQQQSAAQSNVQGLSPFEQSQTAPYVAP